MAKQGTVQADDGSTVALQADSVCVHGDGPKALAFVQKISAALPAALRETHGPVERHGIAPAALFAREDARGEFSHMRVGVKQLFGHGIRT